MTHASLLKIYQDLRDTKNNLVSTLDALVERGESMESLVRKAREIERSSNELLRGTAATASSSRLKKGAAGLLFASICSLLCYLIFVT